MTDPRINKDGQPRKKRADKAGLDYLAKVWPTLVADVKNAKEMRQRAEQAMLEAGRRWSA